MAHNSRFPREGSKSIPGSSKEKRKGKQDFQGKKGKAIVEANHARISAQTLLFPPRDARDAGLMEGGGKGKG